MSSRVALILCLLLAALFGTLSYRAVLTKSPTYDEPCHFGSAYTHVFLHDDRTDPENPMLWKMWAMLPIGRDAMQIDRNDRAWRDIGGMMATKRWYVSALLKRGPENMESLINRSRFVMVLLGLALCLLTAAWAGQIAGPWAALAAAALIALDPTVLANAPLVKNDVPLALAFLAAVLALWRAGRKLTLLNALALTLACAAAINIKFSAVVLPVIILIGLSVRAGMNASWRIFGHEVHSRWRRMLVLPGALLALVLMLTAVTWAVYGFRYAPSPDPSLSFERSAPYGGLTDGVIVFAREHHLLPDAFCTGFLRLHYEIHTSRNYLLGETASHGWWYYYPFALVVKTPLATLIAIVLSLAFAAIPPRSRREGGPWTALCILLPVSIYLLSAMLSDYDHGVRSLLPIFPMIFVAVAVCFARALERYGSRARIIGALLLVGLAVESLAAFPNYLSFFNVAAGGSRGGLRLLGDSNLDWGQDLAQILDWRKQHPDVKIYLAYWGELDPIDFKLDYTPMPGYFTGIPDAPPNPKEPGVLIISATMLQAIYVRPPWDALYAEIRSWKPREVLGGSIYIYDFPSPEMKQYRQ